MEKLRKRTRRKRIFKIKRKFTYYCISKKSVYWIDSTIRLDSENTEQMKWLKRETDDTVFFLFEMPKDPKSDVWAMGEHEFLELCADLYVKKKHKITETINESQ